VPGATGIAVRFAISCFRRPRDALRGRRPAKARIKDKADQAGDKNEQARDAAKRKIHGATAD
jgi:hypothetical protein